MQGKGESRPILPIRTIGIGAGAHGDGQVLVSYDLLGLTSVFPSFEDRGARRPRFVERYAEFYEDGLRASRAGQARTRA